MKRQHFLQAGLAVLALCLLVLACTPPFSRDALIHHLQVPKLYLQHGGMYELPELFFSYYPMNLDLLYMGALWLGSDILPKYLHMAFAFATAVLLYWHLRRRLSSSYAWLGALFFLSIPIIVKLSITVYVDLGLVFFSTAALLLLFRWLETKRLRDLLLAGICCGLGIGTKYNGLLVLFILTFMVPLLFIRSQEQKQRAARPAVKAAVLFCFMALLATSPWLIRNAVWTGNPVYPLYNSFFSRISAPTATDQQQDDAVDAENEEVNKAGSVQGVFARRYILYQENIWQLLLLPIRIFFEGQDGDPRYFDGRLNPFLLLLPLQVFFRPAARQVRIEQIALAAFSLLYFLFAFNTGVLRIRYLVPMVPCLVILSMYGLNNLELLAARHLHRPRLLTAIWFIPVFLLLAWNGNYIRQQFQEVAPLGYIIGRVSRDEYLSRQLPEHPIMQYVNKNLPSSAKILCIFMGRRGYYLHRPHLFDHYGHSKLFLSWLRQPESTAETVLHNLQEQHISHLLLRTDLMAQWLYTAESHQQELWNQLNRNHLVAVNTHLNYILYQVKK